MTKCTYLIRLSNISPLIFHHLSISHIAYCLHIALLWAQPRPQQIMAPGFGPGPDIHSSEAVLSQMRFDSRASGCDFVYATDRYMYDLG